MSRRAPTQEKEVEATGRQVRRRLHTTTTTSRRRRSSAFRERLVELDMAEARREIAAALRVHRASSSSAVSRNGVVPGGHQEKMLPQNLQQPQMLPPQQQAAWMWPPPPLVPLPSVCCDGDDNKSFFSDLYSKYWRGDRSLGLAPVALPAAAGGGLLDMDMDMEYHSAFGIQLPARPLGLNLSLHGLIAGASSVYKYNDEDGKNDMGDGGFDHPLIQLPCAAAVSGSAAASGVLFGGPPAMASVHAPSTVPAAARANPVVPERGDAASALTGTGVEWGGDTAASSWSIEDGFGGELGVQEEGGAIAVAADARWLQYDDQEGVTVAGSGTPDGGRRLETLLDGGDYCCWWPQGEGDAEDITLPCMEIGKIEGWDGEWFA